MSYNLKIKKLDIIPLKAIFYYILLGLVLSFLGPIEYVGYERLPVAIYMMAFLVLFITGYLLGAAGSNYLSKDVNYDYQKYKLKKVLFWVKVSIFIIVIVQFVTLVISLSQGTLNLSISKMGEAYLDTYKGYERGTGNVSLTFLIQTLTYIPYLVTLILGAYYFKYLPKTYRWLVVFSYASIFLLETIGHGKQKQLGDMVVFLMIIILLKSNIHSHKVRKRILRKIFIFGSLGVSAFVTVLYFRYVALGIGLGNIQYKVHPLMYYNADSIVYKIFGYEIGFPISVFTGYLSQGYYGLSLSMNEPFVWTYFFGNSYSLSVLMQRYFGLPLDFHDTYPYRAALHTGWGDSKWSTVFVWFAGDFTFLGTLFFFMLIAYFYAKVWKESYLYANPISIILFANLSIGLLYIPANNQLLHTPGSYLAMVFFVFLWIFKHKKYNFYNTHH